nr:putative RNA-directed DNA polymerase, eukaryota, reverse transcriptase zinc-binding domain protein [Tanacetum cinerariifolium]
MVVIKTIIGSDEAAFTTLVFNKEFVPSLDGKVVNGSRPDCIFRDKLKNVKIALTVWSKERFGAANENIEKYKQEAMKWELEAETRSIDDRDTTTWGLMVEGIWSEDPRIIKGEVLRFYKAIFSDSRGLGDFRPIIGCYYKIVVKLLAKRIKRVIGKIVGDLQNAFIQGRFILDGILIANKTVDFWKKNKKKGLVFKMEACLRSATMSILVNGSPTEEFHLERGILSPFLFIMAVEGINAMVSGAVDKGLFKGIYVGLRVNLSKSRVYGIGVTHGEVNMMARQMGCSVREFPFTYLGLPIGTNMKRKSASRSVVKKFKKRLSEWRAKTMSFGGRLTLVKTVLGSFPLYYFSMFRVPVCMITKLECIRRDFFWDRVRENKKMSWVKRDSVLSSYEAGGLNIGSLRVKNLALMGKWWWRFRNEEDSLWVKGARSVYGADEGLGNTNGGKDLCGSEVWGDVLRVGRKESRLRGLDVGSGSG